MSKLYGAKGLINVQRSDVYYPSREKAISNIRLLADEVVSLQKRLNEVDPARRHRQYKEKFG